MVITGKKFQQQVGNNDMIYVNLGTTQGVKVGDYFRIFRYQGTQHETDYQTPRYAFDRSRAMPYKDVGIYGFGAVSKKYTWEQCAAREYRRRNRACGPDRTPRRCLSRSLCAKFSLVTT